MSKSHKWFREDFVSTYGADDKFKGYSKTERAVLSFVRHYLNKEMQEHLTAQKFSVKYLDYDWSLNEQQ